MEPSSKLSALAKPHKDFKVLGCFSRLKLGELGQCSHTASISVNSPAHNMNKLLQGRAKSIMDTL